MTTMKESEIESVGIMSRCPRFNKCSVPICPLDLLQDLRNQLQDEPTCTFPKSRRYRIGKNTNLPREGLTKKEWAAKVRWQSLTEDERECRIANLKPYR